MNPSQIVAEFWLKEKNSQTTYCPYCPNMGVLPGLAVKEKPKGNIIGEFVLYKDRTEIFLDKSHPKYAELIHERQRANNADSKST